MKQENHIRGKTVLLGVTGGIAAFKAAALASQLTQQGAELHVIMTESAAQFIQPLTFQTLSRNHVVLDTFEERDPGVVSHIDLADRADVVLLAPTTANFMAKLAHGLGDDMLSTTLLATQAPVLMAPAMNVHMYAHPAVQENMKKLEKWGYHFIEPGEGQLACGYVGKGRLEEPETIIHTLNQFLAQPSTPAKQDLTGKKVLVTAGATREKVDPVRFFTNRSTGKMGYAMAEAARDRGAEVILVSGKTALPEPQGITTMQVESAQEMYEAVLGKYPQMDAVVMAAAVADYRPAQVYDHKMKKAEGTLAIEMERTPDILKKLGELKQHQFLIGFAAESQQVAASAHKKIIKKNLDMIAANNILSKGAGFEGDTNIITLFDRDGELCSYPRLSKQEVAHRIWDEAGKKMKGGATTG